MPFQPSPPMKKKRRGGKKIKNIHNKGSILLQESQDGIGISFLSGSRWSSLEN